MNFPVVTRLAAPEPPQRKNTRLQHYDYASPGMYFVTICTHNREMLLSAISHGKIVLTDIGQIVSGAINTLSSHYETVEVDCSVIMPNHIHMILCIQQGTPSNNTLGSIICGMKAEVSRVLHRRIWQRGYHEHIVRNEQDLQEIRTYIVSNPLKWELDRHNPSHSRYGTWRE